MVRKRVLITVMTYPHPSEKHRELVCTAGLTEDGEWIRLYPIDYRYRPKTQQFRKYQWIEVDLEESTDNRKESYRPVLDSIKVIGEPLSTRDNWAERRAIIDRLPHFTREELRAEWENAERDKTSLGIVRPSRIIDLEIRPVDELEWKPKWKALFEQMTLFGPQQKPLAKLPFSFHYHFECDDSTSPHVAMCEDWELGVLFLKERDRLGSDEAAAQSVRSKFLNQLCDPDRDTRFFMGTKYPYNTWLVLGVFWPPRTVADEQVSLFES